MQMTFLMSVLQRVWTCVFQMSVVVRAKQKRAGRTRHGVHASHFTVPTADIPRQQSGVASSARRCDVTKVSQVVCRIASRPTTPVHETIPSLNQRYSCQF